MRIYISGLGMWLSCLSFMHKALASTPNPAHPVVAVHACGCTPGRWRQEDWKCKIIIGCMLSLRPACATGRPAGEKKGKERKNLKHLQQCLQPHQDSLGVCLSSLLSVCVIYQMWVLSSQSGILSLASGCRA